MIKSATMEMGPLAASSTAPDAGRSLVPALRRMAEISAIPPNWDGEAAFPPSAPAVAVACLLIMTVAEEHERTTGRRVAPGTSAPIADGRLQVEWLGGGARIDVEIAPDGTLAYMIKRGTGPNAVYQEADEVDFDPLLGLIAQVLVS